MKICKVCYEFLNSFLQQFRYKYVLYIAGEKTTGMYLWVWDSKVALSA